MCKLYWKQEQVEKRDHVKSSDVSSQIPEVQRVVSRERSKSKVRLNV